VRYGSLIEHDMSEEQELENELRGAVTSQDLSPLSIADFMSRVERLVAEDPSKSAFAREMALLANEGEREANKIGADDVPWAALDQLLRELY
jgi:hypothetical protein